LRLLARREYSRVELSRRLGRYAQSEEELEQLLDTLQAQRKLSDERYAEMRVHSMTRKYGAGRILQELKSKGIEGELAERVVGETSASELERARAAWQRKFRALPESREERAKHARFLQARGFSFDVIRAVLKGEETGD
jgi:regulatory protein